MKIFFLGAAAIGIVASLLPMRSTPQIVILTGDANGNLSPCGCTKPMTGGFKRRITAAKQLSIPGHTTFLDNGSLVSGIGRQDEIKAQTMAQMLAKAGWNAINVSPSDARLGLGLVLSLNSLSDGKLVASNVAPSTESNLAQYVISPPFLVIGVSAHPDLVSQPLGQSVVPLDEAISQGLEQAKAADLTPVLLLQGDHSESELLAKKYPALKLIEYSSIGSPRESAEVAGDTTLVSPGSDGKYLVRLEFNDGKFSNYLPVSLGPQYKDDPEASRLFREYLSRVDQEGLLEKQPRLSTASYSGSKACGTCHAAALISWDHSLHSHALATLAGRGENRDPECLECHVVGVSSDKGFLSPKATPDLAAVGCESCHGPGAAHSASPKTIRLPNVTASTCAICHTTNTSPNFSFETFWPRIKH